MKAITHVSIFSGIIALASCVVLPSRRAGLMITDLEKRVDIGATFCTGNNFTGDCQTFVVPASTCSKHRDSHYTKNEELTNCVAELPASLNDTVSSVTPTSELCYFFE